MSTCWGRIYLNRILHCAGSGKTYTMQPLPLRAAADMFALLADPQFADLSLWVSCFEIYGGKLYDLLNGYTHFMCQLVLWQDVTWGIGTYQALWHACAGSALNIYLFCTSQHSCSAALLISSYTGHNLPFGVQNGSYSSALLEMCALPWAGVRGWRCARTAASACASSA